MAVAITYLATAVRLAAAGAEAPRHAQTCALDLCIGAGEMVRGPQAARERRSLIRV